MSEDFEVHPVGTAKRLRLLGEAETLAAHSGETKRREWHNVGAWLYPGDLIAVVRKERSNPGDGDGDAC